ncbi:hypothetical protein BOX15_Mlig026168g1 [Macrostomum lignano]|nr:hypothetical protein BOX15_Mlig026168g1 [Macrostomum lignano]
MGYPQDGRDQEHFIRDIMAAAAKVQEPGELLLIGLCVVSPYVERYGSPITAAEDSGYLYECLGADKEFVGKMLDRRYQHQFNANSANTLTRNEQFATLLFKRQNPQTTQAQHLLKEK